jgi:Fur family transcriptional regulator, peroxide stress response regulator
MSTDTMRATPQRRAVLEVLTESTDHPTASQVLDRVRQRVPELGGATVYRTLALLVASGTVAEIRLGDGRAVRYDHTTDRHDHLVCVDCGRVEDVSIPIGRKVLDQIAASTSFTPIHYEVKVHGRCADCAPSDV